MNTLDRRAFLATSGALVVGFSWSGTAVAAAVTALAPAKAVDKTRIESFVAMGGDGRATIYVGKVDLGNGSRTALAQLAADELDLPFERITMVMGDTGSTPDQWITGASTTIAQGGMELRRACAPREPDDECAGRGQEGSAINGVHGCFLLHAVTGWPEARCTARTMRWCVPQRHRFIARPSRICCSLGFGVRLSKSAACITMPLMQ